MQVNMHEAKSQLSKLGELAWQGEDVVIAKAGKPYLHLVPFRRQVLPRKLGAWKGKVWTAPDFGEDIEMIDLFESSKVFPDADV